MNKKELEVDPEMAEFEEALLRSLKQTSRGECCVTTEAQIVMRRAGRPTGSLEVAPKLSNSAQ